jgi:maleylacetoacetate isomerase/maleylpyruvate isomerase
MAQQPAFELFAFWRSSATFRIRVALNLKGLRASEHLVDIDAGAQHHAGFLALNPLAAIPALRVPGQAPLTQSLAILEYLDELQPAPPLLPGDLYGRARVRSIAAMLASDTHPLVTPRVKKYLTARAAFDAAAWRAWQLEWFGTGMRALEQRLASEAVSGKFCHGEKPTIADICLASVVAVMRVFEIAIADTPTIDRVMAACDAHEAFAKAEPRRQQGAPRIET